MRNPYLTTAVTCHPASRDETEGWSTFSVKRQIVKTVGFTVHMASAPDAQLCCCSAEAAVDRLWMTRHGSVPMELYLQKQIWHTGRVASLWSKSRAFGPSCPEEPKAFAFFPAENLIFFLAATSCFSKLLPKSYIYLHTEHAGPFTARKAGKCGVSFSASLLISRRPALVSSERCKTKVTNSEAYRGKKKRSFLTLIINTREYSRVGTVVHEEFMPLEAFTLTSVKILCRSTAHLGVKFGPPTLSLQTLILVTAS